ncbi:MAG: pyridoxamine 5'-phosphate oxidase family protein [Anaerolineae bacterium]|nr:pyridoxamine 5'-phosphate oxidase family protein [Anaerolineae bacterium]
MTTLPEIVSQAWEEREGPIVLTTVAADGTPNAIYATCVKKYSEDRLVVADNYFDKTRANIQNHSKGTLLFITKDRKAYQVKGTLTYETDGEIYADMKQWLAPKYPGHAAAVLHVEEVYNGAKKLG